MFRCSAAYSSTHWTTWEEHFLGGKLFLGGGEIPVCPPPVSVSHPEYAFDRCTFEEQTVHLLGCANTFHKQSATSRSIWIFTHRCTWVYRHITIQQLRMISFIGPISSSLLWFTSLVTEMLRVSTNYIQICYFNKKCNVDVKCTTKVNPSMLYNAYRVKTGKPTLLNWNSHKRFKWKMMK